MSRLAYFVRETLISLRRNLLMTIAGIITVSVSLFLFGGIMLVQRTVDHGTDQWKHGVELEIFMEVDATNRQIADLRKQLDDRIPQEVTRYRFLNKQDAYNEFKKLFRDDHALVESITPDDLPTSFRVVPVKPELTDKIDNEFNTVPGVKSVVTARETVRRLLTITRAIRYFFITLAVVLLASSLFLIVNTIRLATFARRREIEVMKLVGASNWFVRVPFMAEGLVQGAIGAGFAFGLVYGLKIVISNYVGHRSTNLLHTFYVTNADAIAIGTIVVLIGAGIGVIGSAIGLRRFLEA